MGAVGYGKVVFFDEIRIGGTVFGGGGGGGGHPDFSLNVETYNLVDKTIMFPDPTGVIDNPLTYAPGSSAHIGVAIGVLGTVLPTFNTCAYTVSLPCLAWSSTTNLRPSFPTTCEVVLTNYLALDTGSAWYTTVGRIEVWVNGASIHYWTSVILPSINQPIAYVNAASMPLFGGGIFAGCGCGVNPPTVEGGPYVGGSASGNATAWIKKRQGSTWLSEPFTASPGSGVASGTLDSIILSATETQSGSYYNSGQVIWIMPDLPKGIVRMNSDYSAGVLCGGFDAWGTDHYTSTYTGTQLFGIGPPLVSHSYSTYLNRQDAQAAVLTGAVNPVEAPFSSTVYSPAATVVHTCTQAASPSSPYTASTTFTQFVPIPGGGATYPSWWPLGHQAYPTNLSDSAFGRYACTWANPHWNFALLFPTETEVLPYAWPLNGTAESPLAYWLPGRQQWLGGSKLGAAATGQRVDVVAEPLTNTPLTGAFMLASWQVRTSPVGVSRFGVFPLSSGPQSTPGNSTARWSATGGTIVQNGSGLTFGAGVTKLEYSVQDYHEAPYMLPSWAESVACSFAGLTTFQAFLVGEDGSAALLGTAAGTYVLPAAAAAKWAGSWGMDFGQGAVADTYSPIASGSDGTSGVDQAQFGQMPGRSGMKLRFTFDPTLGGETFGVLTFAPPALSGGMSYTVTGRHQYVLFPGASYLVAGALDYSGGIYPGVAPLSNQSKLGDLLCWANSFLNGAPSTSGILALAQGQFDPTYEVSVLADLWGGWSGFLMPTSTGLAVAGVYGLRELPPISMAPRKARDADWNETGVLSCYSYSWVASRRRLLHPGSLAPVLKDPGGVSMLSAEAAPAGWTAQFQEAAVTNSEGYDDTLSYNAVDLCKLRPWRGFFSILGLPANGKAMHAERDDELGFTYTLRQGAGGAGLDVWRHRLNLPDESFHVVPSGTVVSAQLGWHPWGRFLAWYCDADGCKLTESRGDESAWGTPVLIQAGATVVAAATDRVDGWQVCLCYDPTSTNWNGYRRRSPAGAFEALGVVASGPAQPAALEFDYGPRDRLLFWYDNGSGVAVLSSPDLGSTWS